MGSVLRHANEGATHQRSSIRDIGDLGKLARPVIAADRGGVDAAARGIHSSRGCHWNSVLSWPAGGSCEFAMTLPLTAIVGVPMPDEPGWIGVFAVISVT
ncbi:hypothetical protein FB391_0350 [Microbacterium kyungheense]|uniref:Uncharacterized protein n=1 Tax=Microbacterium kyungheense TaxID=1263636 RepID=A0A543FJL1_9MICO|nr:hypothetical protein FB391_0350 [Microbacterium kyungheense]